MEPKRKNIHCNEQPHMQLGMSSKPTLSEQTRFPDEPRRATTRRYAKFAGGTFETGKVNRAASL